MDIGSVLREVLENVPKTTERALQALAYFFSTAGGGLLFIGAYAGVFWLALPRLSATPIFLWLFGNVGLFLGVVALGYPAMFKFYLRRRQTECRAIFEAFEAIESEWIEKQRPLDTDKMEALKVCIETLKHGLRD